MKHIIKTILLSAMILIFAISCEKVFYFDLPDDERKIVLNGIIAPGYGLWLNVSQSVSTSEMPIYSYVPLSNALVEYYEKDDLISSLRCYDSGDYYETDFKPLENTEYKIVVKAPGFPEASALVRIPEKVEITGFDTSTVIKRVDNNMFQYEIEFNISFSIADPETAGNHYMLGIYFRDNDDYYPVAAESEDLNMNIYIKDGINVLAWSDQHINGQSSSFDVKFNLNNYKGYETDIELRLYTIEEAYFKYLKTYSQNYTVLNDGSLLYEPVLVSSNVSGGYGVIAAVNTSRVSFHYRF